MPEWHDELGLSEGALLIDFGACPWCGAEYIHVAANGKAAGRKPPDDCCIRGAMAAIARIRSAMHRPAPDTEHLQREARALAAKLASASPNEFRAAARDVEGRYGLKVDWGAILARARREA
jgi:hypothetical protein